MKRFVIALHFLLLVLVLQAQQTIVFNDTLSPVGDMAYSVESIVQSDFFYYLSGEWMLDGNVFTIQLLTTKTHKIGDYFFINYFC